MRMFVFALLLGVFGPAASTIGDTVYWVGYQNECMVDPPNLGSFFHGDNWLNFAVPQPEDRAVFGSGVDPGGDGYPHHVYFGDACVKWFACPDPIPIPGGNAVIDALNVQSDTWVFDFSSAAIGPCVPPGSRTGGIVVQRWFWLGNTVQETGLPGTAALEVVGPGTFRAQYTTLAAVPGAGGALAVRGTNTEFVGDAAIFIGRDGIGTAVIEGGATATVGYSSTAHHPGGNGSLTVRGPGSSWSGSRFHVVGVNGPGALTVEDAATFTADGLMMGEQTGGTGNAIINTGGVVTTNYCGVGSLGVGSLSINNAALSTIAMTIGEQSGGRGTVTMSNGAELATSGDSPVYIGRSGVGSCDVDGSESRMTIGSQVQIGRDAVGEVSVRNGGRVEVVGRQPNTGGLSVLGGLNDGGDGTVDVDGVGTVFWSRAQIQVGRSGAGALNITNGGKVESFKSGSPTGTSGLLGRDPSGSGFALVRDEDSLWRQDGALTIGWSGSGLLSIENGGMVQCMHGIVGRQVGSNGESAVRNAGSEWEITGNLTLGGYDSAPGGAASLAVSDSGRVSVGEQLMLWPGSSVSVSNATITIGEIEPDNTDTGLVLGAGGVLTGEGSLAGNLVNDAGVIDLGRDTTIFLVDGALTQRSPATLISDIAGTSRGVEYDSLNVLGHASLAGTLVVRISPEFAPEPGDEFLVLSYASRDGEFDTILNEGNQGGFRFVPEYAPFGVILRVTIARGDIDRDGDVDLDDFTIFSECIAGPAVPPAETCPAGVDADLDDDGDVDMTDFAGFSVLYPN